MRRTTCTLVRNSRGGPRALGVSERDGGDPLGSRGRRGRRTARRTQSADARAIGRPCRPVRRESEWAPGPPPPGWPRQPTPMLLPGRCARAAKLAQSPRSSLERGTPGCACRRLRSGVGSVSAGLRLLRQRSGHPDLARSFSREPERSASTRRVVGQALARRGSASRRCHEGDTSDGAAVNDAERVASYRRLMVGRGGTRRRS